MVVDVPPGAIVGLIDDYWQRSLTDLGLPGPDGTSMAPSTLRARQAIAPCSVNLIAFDSSYRPIGKQSLTISW